MLGLFEHPERSLKKVILVAGTNGKGSTAHLIAKTLQHGGYGVGLFISPHLNQFCERIQIQSVPISPKQVARLYQEIQAKEVAALVKPTFFECATLMAVLTFARQNVDVAVFEVGLGGRLDATNALSKDISVLTRIAMDHEHFLGNTLTSIAKEKADIIPSNGLVVVGSQEQEAMDVIASVAKHRNATLVQSLPVAHKSEGLAFDLKAHETAISFTPPSNSAQYQMENFAIAAAVWSVLPKIGLSCSVDCLQSAAQHFVWPGRYEWVKANGIDVVLDGAHNPSAMQALCDSLVQDARTHNKSIHCVFSALKDKNAEQMLEILSPFVCSIHICPLASPRTLSPEETQTLCNSVTFHKNLDGFVHQTVGQALEKAMRMASQDQGLVIVTGSLCLVGNARCVLTGDPSDPPVDG